ncbi:MAG: FkbM family methyltransferase [Aquabacterium sp.]|nr:MAG: FkbM family methyltransferase [Aquabacterium sp.]
MVMRLAHVEVDGRLRLLRTFFVSRLVARWSRQVKRAGYPRLAVIPHDSIGREVVFDGMYEKDLLESIFEGALHEFKQGFAQQVALDVGGNIGNHSMYFARRFRKVIAFEPNPPVAKIFEANCLLNGIRNVELIQVGLGEQPARLTFVSNAGDNIGGSGFIGGSARESDGEVIELPIERGDDVLAQRQLGARVGLLKIDVEGFELFALRGLRDTLVRDQPFVLFESHGNSDSGGKAVMNFLRECGYRQFLAVEKSWRVPRWARRRGVWPLVEFVQTVIHSPYYRCEPIQELEDRYYSLLLASPSPIM